VWDVLSDEEAVNLLLDKYRTEGPFEGAAELLVSTAIDILDELHFIYVYLVL
jgi:hypothetical protein